VRGEHRKLRGAYLSLDIIPVKSKRMRWVKKVERIVRCELDTIFQLQKKWEEAYWEI
jgi:hypothetical protein